MMCDQQSLTVNVPSALILLSQDPEQQAKKHDIKEKISVGVMCVPFWYCMYACADIRTCNAGGGGSHT
eukprot:5318561-Ditylum_brightwellii.AAC.1